MGPGFPFPPGFDFNELMRMLQSSGPVNLEIARQTATAVANSDLTTGETRAVVPVDPSAAAVFDQLVRAAQLAVADATGITETMSLTARCVDRQTWATTTLDALAPVLESLAHALQARGGLGGPDAGDPSDAANQANAFVGMLMQTLVPFVLGSWAGGMLGQLSHRALGQFDLPLPLEGFPVQLFVVENVDAFAEEWSLPVDELRYAVVLREVVHGGQRTIPWVRERVARLASAYVGAYEARPEAFEELLAGLDITDPSSMESLEQLADPGQILDRMKSDRQGPILEELQRFVSVLEGYTDVAVESLGDRMISSHGRIDEALRRHRLERGEATAYLDRLLGLELDRRHYEEGAAFCRGVVERASFDQLNRLWTDEAMVPTRAELEAPGLWLARIDLPELPDLPES
jgi:putative hydrolase